MLTTHNQKPWKDEMTKERYNEIMNDNSELTEEEMKRGWHFCQEWDRLLIHPSMKEADYCNCPAYNQMDEILF